MRKSKYEMQPYSNQNNFQMKQYSPPQQQKYDPDRKSNNPFDDMNMPLIGFGHNELDIFGNKGFGSKFGGIFGRMENMFEDMHKEMQENFNQLSHHMNSGNGGAHCYQQTYVSKTTMGPDGKPRVEKYETKAVKGVGKDGKKIAERQQLYQNSYNQYEKAAHERLLNNQGRKLVIERQGNDSKSHDVYKNLDENNAREFDSNWENARKEIGFNSNTAQRMLGYASEIPNYKNKYSPSYGNYQEETKALPFSHNYNHQYNKPKYGHERQYEAEAPLALPQYAGQGIRESNAPMKKSYAAKKGVPRIG